MFGWINPQIGNKAKQAYNDLQKGKTTQPTVDIGQTTKEGEVKIQVAAEKDIALEALETEDLSPAAQARKRVEAAKPKIQKTSQFRKAIGIETGGEIYNRVLDAARKALIRAYKSGQAAVANKIGAILILAVLCAVFWACFEQAGSSIVVWADKCIDLKFMVASQTNAINPAYIIFLAFPFALLWQKLDLWGKNPNTAKKFAMGIAFLGLGFLVFAYSINFISDAGKLPFSTLWIGWLLITTGALQSIPRELIEAAKVDGATSLQAFWRITFPLLMVSISPLLIGSFAFNFNNFTLIFLLSGGGPPVIGSEVPVGWTDILISFTYKLAISGGRGNMFGLASTVTIIVFSIVLIISAISFRYTKRLERIYGNI